MKKVFYSDSKPTAIVVANDEAEARTLLDAEFAKCGLEGRDYILHRVSRAEVGVTLLTGEADG